MDLNAIIQEFCHNPPGTPHRPAIYHDAASMLSLPTLPTVAKADASLLSDTAWDLGGTHGLAAELEVRNWNGGKMSSNQVAFPEETQPGSPLDDLQIRENYALLQEKYHMMESAARAEISELRARLLEAHQKLADVDAARAVSGFSEKISARHACEEEMQLSQQKLLVARAGVTQHFEKKLWSANRFGPPENLVRRLQNCPWEWLQHHCLLVWRALVKLKPDPKDLRQAEDELRCWDKARRLRLAGSRARQMFSAWRVHTAQQERGRRQKLIDFAHDSWHMCHASVRRAIDDQFCTKSLAVASRCFFHWLGCSRKSKQLARFWRWLARERKFMRWCFISFLRAVSANRQDRIYTLDDAVSASRHERNHMLDSAKMVVPSLAAVSASRQDLINMLELDSAKLTHQSSAILHDRINMLERAPLR